ncbi:unnamed protein product [Cylindrotheca closterium]|uniref:Uncharacterized protein n=1 Tax=Cylindrotheca closterium TaxID=2856 RepID=A0AAD2JHC1_9STRA|nr:unnamed protein product [Cylindrotheca closterium]
MLTNFRLFKGGIKGINGSPTSITGIGKLSLPIPGTTDRIEVDAVVAPTSPSNIMPPQLVYKAMKCAGWEPEWPRHNDTEYKIAFTAPSQKEQHEINVKIDDRDLFVFQSEPGYKNFCMSTSTDECNPATKCGCDHNWHAYSGTTHFKSKATIVSIDSASEGAPKTASEGAHQVQVW